MVIVIHFSFACGSFKIKRSVITSWFIWFVPLTNNFMCLLLCFIYFKKFSTNTHTYTHTHTHTRAERKYNSKTAISYSKNANRIHQKRDGCSVYVYNSYCPTEKVHPSLSSPQSKMKKEIWHETDREHK